MVVRRTLSPPRSPSSHVNVITCLQCDAEIPTDVPDREGVQPLRCPDPACGYVQGVRYRPIMDMYGGNLAAVAWMAEAVPRE